MVGMYQSQIKHIWGTRNSGVLKLNSHTFPLKKEELLWDFPILTFCQAWELNSLKVLMIPGMSKPPGHSLHLNSQLPISPLQSSLVPLCSFSFRFPSLQLLFIFSFNHVEKAWRRWRKHLLSKGRKMPPQETHGALQRKQMLMPLGTGKSQTDSPGDRLCQQSRQGSVDLDDIVPLINRPDSIVLHVEGWALPVPGLHWHLPLRAVVGLHILQGFTGHVDLELHKLSPAQSKLGKEIPVPEQKGVVTGKRLKCT